MFLWRWTRFRWSIHETTIPNKHKNLSLLKKEIDGDRKSRFLTGINKSYILSDTERTSDESFYVLLPLLSVVFYCTFEDFPHPPPAPSLTLYEYNRSPCFYASKENPNWTTGRWVCRGLVLRSISSRTTLIRPTSFVLSHSSPPRLSGKKTWTQTSSLSGVLNNRKEILLLYWWLWKWTLPYVFNTRISNNIKNNPSLLDPSLINIWCCQRGCLFRLH